MGLSEDLRTHLATHGLATDVYVGGLVDRPDEQAALLEYPGAPPENRMSSALGASRIERPRVQVLARGTTYASARARAEALLAKLHWLQNTTLNGTRYLLVEALQRPPFHLRTDANERVIFAFNLQVVREST